MLSIDTIYALSSGSLPAGVAIIRVSGPETADALVRLCGTLPPPRIATLRTIRTRNGETLDSGLVLYFPAPASFTGEDCCELQVHGGRAVVSAILDELAAIGGLRHAEAGEFARRAFQNGKLDLVEVEGLADLIAAETEMQRRLAIEQSGGGQSALYAGWARRLTHSRAMIEAELDFADEDDVPGSVSAVIWEDVGRLRQEIDGHIARAGLAEIIRDGLKIVIAGEPNAGKSSLLNALARRDIAIVTEVAGTTRDVLSVDLSLAGFSVKLFDTAGLRETDELVEREGIRRARQVIADADLVLLLSEKPGYFRIDEVLPENVPVIRVATKVDRPSPSWAPSDADIFLSTRTGEGMADLLTALQSHLPDLAGRTALAMPSRKRHVDCLRQASAALERSLISSDLELRAEQLRQAGDALGRITGRVDVENLLDVIFSEFCIGK
ncbi:tRNA uridine-5-carboxymethylaminomethyl(34) synthesis GTPase MnmE [Sinorhizobium meliloti WSM1022]|jgi:tRNA modification GTPase|uniref:tRNA uridine-5-carboxymethylaminomethyl(34) synthesis GTPase MnmE n=1 Tax=Rhizobium meliloti TaxID=382 RepID=UPI000410F1B6|nr:tRNA uridine-5-carboxymethylaminomethyl(34) synthesis GTPase MnmE [Sinorhizobium meliloti]ASQ05614.1 tRNA modification GTPase [Sinorhizobium meliloti]MCO6424088.1 tRNA uridine-5-carboxymethylaminomethyl(34) synthesis GTPase MnmE [Sinorhizobium meliloti]MDW9411875.1 tRNA uridine-5-carboxymethylaminomethyl(34) synthesis GTPase MnmE [Sinorhizobium meliloti]MDW9445329.1 tRNA uridine-5-carboxymethylaminomethyl(34) synthesis GTPase MnmE [Sinorhizobium meliloti]MDW9457430.1 tRNA uridine-5-carboxym